MEKSTNIIIQAKNVDDFKYIQEKLDTLPLQVYNQIESARVTDINRIIICNIPAKAVSGNMHTLILPSNMSVIQNDKNRIVILSRDNTFTFHLDKRFDLNNCKITILAE